MIRLETEGKVVDAGFYKGEALVGREFEAALLQKVVSKILARSSAIAGRRDPRPAKGGSSAALLNKMARSPLQEEISTSRQSRFSLDFRMRCPERRSERLAFRVWQREPLVALMGKSHPLAEERSLVVDELEGVPLVAVSRRVAPLEGGVAIPDTHANRKPIFVEEVVAFRETAPSYVRRSMEVLMGKGGK